MAGEGDLRVRRTQRALITAMLTLLTHTPFTKITVNDLCAQAMVSRSAFYAHFQDKYDLMRRCLAFLSEQLFNAAGGTGLKARLRLILERIHADGRIFYNLMIAAYDNELIDLIKQGFLEDFARRRADAGDCASPLPEPAEIAILFYATGVTAAIIHWISGRMRHSVDEMCACLCALLPDAYFHSGET